MSIESEALMFSNDELLLLDKLGIRLRKGKVKAKVEKSEEEKELIKRALDTGMYVTKGGGDGSKPRLNTGVGDFVRGLIKEGLDNKAILIKVEEKYKNTNTNMGCVRWYRDNLKSREMEGKK